MAVAQRRIGKYITDPQRADIVPGMQMLVKSKKWYSDNSDDWGTVCINRYYNFTAEMSDFLGKVVTVEGVHHYEGLGDTEVFSIKEDGGRFRWCREMFDKVW